MSELAYVLSVLLLDDDGRYVGGRVDEEEEAEVEEEEDEVEEGRLGG
jgi:hypothetical protein